MEKTSRGELILFPKTVDYYQIELTKLLESEAYGEAIHLLEFLAECKTGDDRMNEEWRNLLHWMVQQFPDAAAKRSPQENKSHAEAEEDLLRASVNAKIYKDHKYAKRLLDMFPHASIDKQLVALDQLAYSDADETVPKLKRLLLQAPLHPFVSFKLLQTLAKLGAVGELTFGKLGEIVTVEVERTPLTPDDFPECLLQVNDRVQKNVETDDPTLSYFAKETWEEYIKYIYGTVIYREIIHMDDPELDVWASSLHAAVSKAMYGSDAIDEFKDRYGITEALQPAWEKSYRSLLYYFQDGGRFYV